MNNSLSYILLFNDKRFKKIYVVKEIICLLIIVYFNFEKRL